MSDNATTNEPFLLLRKDRQDVPAWLMSHQPGAPLDWEAFGRSRIVYYPGSGDDGHPLKLFSRAHAAHCFILADYFLEPELFVRQLTVSGDERGVIGYGTIDYGRTSPRKVWPGILSSQRRLAAANPEYEKQAWGRRAEPYIVWAVLERSEGFGEEHGPQRLCVVIVGDEAVATYDALFGDSAGPGPFAVVLQDHGLGGNWCKFGGEESPLFKLTVPSKLPKWLLVGDDGEDALVSERAWPGYAPVSSVTIGGADAKHSRRLYTLVGV